VPSTTSAFWHRWSDTMTESPASDTRLRSGLAVPGVLLLLVLFASQMYIWINWWPLKIDWATAFAWSLPQFVLWLLQTPFAIFASRRWSIDDRSRGLWILGHLAISIAYSVVGLGVIDVSDRVLHWAALLGAPVLVTSVRYTIIHLHWGTAIYWLVVAADQTMKYYTESRDRAVEASRLSARLTEATLAALRGQLNPHFLFNTLNSIAVLIRQQPAQAEQMVHRLAAFLRLTLVQSDRSLIPLRDELAFATGYLEIERHRFADRLAVQVDVESSLLDVMVPTLILQPLVENAVRHGIGPWPDGGTITIRGREVGDRLELTVMDDGAGPPPSWQDGVGFANVRRRLEAHFREQAQVAAGKAGNRGFLVCLRLPFHAGTEPTPAVTVA